MDKSRFTRPRGAFLLGLAVGSLLFGSALNAQAAVSQSPLSLTVGVPPNLTLTLDDSGSMVRAFVPEDIRYERASRRVKSSTYNPMYYNPAVTYRIPKKFDGNGNEIAPYETSFDKAWNNGFLPDNTRGSLNLTNNYKVSWNYAPLSALPTTYGDSLTSPRLAENPAQDFSAATISSKTESNSTVETNQSVGTSSNNTCPTSKSPTTNTTTETIENGDTTTTTITTIVKKEYSGIYCTGKKKSWTLIATVTTTTTTETKVSKPGLTKSGVPAYYYLYDKSLTGCTADQADDNCYRLVWVNSTSGINGTDERKNFAIWYSFYRNRALATLSAARLAFAELSPTVRMTWQALNNCTSLNGTADGCGDNKFRDFSNGQRGRLFSWFDTLDFSGGTPLRSAMDRAGKFLKTETPWQKYPNDSSQTNTTANTYACRPSYHLLMTDGIWNGSDGSPGTPFNHDGTSISLPDGKSYSSSLKPYGDDTNNTLADLAMHYWATDLRTTLPNKLTPYVPYSNDNANTQYWDPRNDPATWQHMVNFTMGLGLTRGLSEPGLEWEGSTFAGSSYANLKSGGADWPAAGSDSSNNVYDLWHAAINSRGEFFSVDSPDSMVQAFEDILNRIAERKSTAARPAITSGLIESEDGSETIKSYYYQTSYASDENWSGDLKRRCRGCDADNPDKLVDDWSAKSQLPSANARTIKIAGSGSNGLQDFTWSNAGSATTPSTLAYYLSDNPETTAHDGTLGEDRLAYLRGNRSKEGESSTDFRRRTSVLGDLYASSPVTVSGPRYLKGFADRLEGNTAYSSFANSIEGSATGSTKRTSRVYVGGNDGMLHAFNSETGVEEFAFIPTAIFPKLNKLTGKNYTHEFYVDGSPVVADVYNGTEWRTILVGTLRAGGKALFALDVTIPGQEKLLWEFDASKVSEASAVKPGYSFPRPTIARLHNGKWAVVTGNGYEGDNTSGGKAALYIIDAISGTLTKSLEVTGTTGVANGLSSPTLADYDADGVADYAYAGDLQGNLWRFDLFGQNASPTRDTTQGSIYGDKSGNTNLFAVSYAGKPMFKATASTNNSARQPITAAPSLIRHPSGSGYLIVFGTGRFFEDGDKDGVKTHAQSVYAIWDRQTRAETTTEYIVSRSQLVQQTITNAVTGSDGTTNTAARIISNTPIAWITKDDQGKELTSKTKYGWYLDLQVKDGALDGEMLVENMATLGQTLFFQTLIPNDDPCADGASNWTYALNPYTGGRTNHHAFEIHYLNGEIKEVVSAIKQDGEGGITIAQRPDRNFELCTGQECVKVYPDPASIGRQTWRKVTEE